ncbi:MAG: response regulator transcription factor [Pseudomonadota bacterium]
MIRVGIVDDHAVVRAGLNEFLSAQPDIHVVGEAGNGREALVLARRERVDVLLMDLCMPGQNGMEALGRIKARAPGLRVLILSGYPESLYGARLIRQGADGFLNKNCEPDDIVAAVRTVAAGKCHASVDLQRRLSQPESELSPLHSQFSDRELEIFLKLARGLGNSDVARTLCLSPRTVTTCRMRILEKMGMASTQELTRYALQNGLIE